MAAELKDYHTAVLRAEVAKLSEMFQLEETDINRLRLAARGAAISAVERNRNTLMATVNKNTGYLLNRSDIDMSAFKINGRYIRIAPAPKVLDSVKKLKEHHGSYIDADTGLWVDIHVSAKVKRRAANTSISVGFYGSFAAKVGPTDVDVQNDKVWKKAISAVLTKEQLGQYTEHSKNQFKSTLVELLMTSLQFELDLQDSQIPIVRKRLEERFNPDPTKTSQMEATVGRYLKRVSSEDLADILPQEQLDQFTEHTKDETKSAVVALILEVLQFDLHLSDSQLPVVRKRLKERINAGDPTGTLANVALRTRWKLKEQDFADILSEPQRTLWRFTQGE